MNGGFVPSSYCDANAPSVVRAGAQNGSSNNNNKNNNNNNTTENMNGIFQDECSTQASSGSDYFGALETDGTLQRAPRNTRESVLHRLSEALLRRSLTKIDLSQRGLQPSDARLVKMAVLQNAHLTVLKLGYNNLEDRGACWLADGISKHDALESLDLGFNNIGDEGCCALAKAIRSPPLRTLYLAGNLIGHDGALGLADLIRSGSSIRKLYLTGNCLGPDGVCAITEAIEEDELRNSGSYDDATKSPRNTNGTGNTRSMVPPPSGVEELFLGGTSMGSEGCQAVARLLRGSNHLKVISLPNCELTNDDILELSLSLKAARDRLPLTTLQLSFNQITADGIEHVVNAIWGSTTLKELLIDNNEIGDRGAQQLATVLPYVENLESIDVGFNGIKSLGMKHFMTAVAETRNLKTLSLSGNHLDNISAKFVAYALAFNQSLVSLNLVNCSSEQNILRQIAAGIVSNKNVALRDLIGFDFGPLVVSLGFPDAIAHWQNEHVLNFLHLMWDNFGKGLGSSLDNAEERRIDPLHFLPGNESDPKPAPVPAAVVVELAQNAFNTLVQEGHDVFSRRPGHPKENLAPPSPFLRNHTFVVEADGDNREDDESCSSTEHIASNSARSFIAPLEISAVEQSLPDPGRKRRIVEWLCKNIKNLNKFAQQPFSSAEIWRLHQHYFAPVVNESGGPMIPSTPSGRLDWAEPHKFTISSIPEVSRTSSSNNPSDGVMGSRDGSCMPTSDPTLKQSTPAIGSFSMLKRKVSYRFLGDATLSSPSGMDAFRRATNSQQPQTQTHFSTMFINGGGQTTSTMPRKTKRARRNRSRISFMPRIKAKLDSQLDVCHEKALVLMRQLYYVEQAILNGEVNPIDPSITTRTHLSADFAADAETIIMDMI